MQARSRAAETNTVGLMLAAAIALAAATLLDWFNEGLLALNAWQAFPRTDLVVGAVCALGLVVALGVLGGRFGGGHQLLGIVVAVAATLTTVAVINASADPPGEATIGAGLYIGAIAILMLAVSGALLAAVSTSSAGGR